MSMQGKDASARRLEIPAFDSWMKTRKVIANDISHAIFSDGGTEYRGVIAGKNLAEGDTIAVVPRDSALCLLRDESAPTADLSEFWDAHPQWYVRLGTKLLLERDQGSSSAVSGYIALLPTPDQRKQFPVEWPTEQVSQLRYEKVEDSISRQRTKWLEIIADFRSLCPQRVSWSDADLRWAWHMCLSRAFAGNFGGGLLSLVPVFGLFVEMKAQGGGGCDYALIPMVDSCNHDGSLPATNLEFSPLTRTLTLKASKAGTQEGEQVFITYGPLSNDELLQRFGYVEAGCQHDSFCVSKNQLASALQVQGGRDAIETELIERGLGATCLDTLVLRKRGKVDRQVEVELALGMLFGDDSKGVAGLERASKTALHRLCQVLVDRMNAPDERALNKQVVGFREAKSAILREMILATAKFP